MKKIINIILFLFLIDSILNEEYELTDGIAQNFTNFKKLEYYFFYIKATQSKIINIFFNLKTSDMNVYLFFINSYISEYSNRYSTYHSRKFISISTSLFNNEIVAVISYKVLSSSTNYISLELRPNLDIYYIVAEFDVLDAVYDLNNNISLNITNLKSNQKYLFYVDVFEGQKVNFNLAMNYMTSLPLSNVYIYEYKNRNIPYLKSTNMSISLTTKNNQFLSTFSYIVSSDLIKYISLLIIPSYNINYMNIKFELPLVIFYLNNSIPKTINNLISEKIYLFFIEATQYAKTTINFNINKTKDDKPFNGVNIYEYEQSLLII